MTTSREGLTLMTDIILDRLNFAGKLLHAEFSGKRGATKIKNFLEYFPGFGSIPFDGGAKKEDLKEFLTMGGKGGFEGGRAIATAALILFGGKITIKVYDAMSDLGFDAARRPADAEHFSMRASYRSEASTHDIHLILNGEGTHFWTASPKSAWTFAQDGSINHKPFTAGVTPAPPKMLSRAEIQALIAKAVRGPLASGSSAAAKPFARQQPASPSSPRLAAGADERVGGGLQRRQRHPPQRRGGRAALALAVGRRRGERRRRADGRLAAGHERRAGRAGE